MRADAGDDPDRGPAGRDPQLGRCAGRSASAWCTSISISPRALPCWRTCWSACPGRTGGSIAPGGAGAAGRDRPATTACGSIPTGRSAHSRGRRAAAAGDRQGAVPRRPPPDPRRADRGARPRRGARACSRRCAAMAAQGLGIIFISHKLNEVRALTHRCVVLRHGRVVAAASTTPASTTAAGDGAADVRPRDRRRRRRRRHARARPCSALDGVSHRRARRHAAARCVAGAARGRDPRHRRRLRQRPARAGRRGRGRAARRRRDRSRSPAARSSASRRARCRRSGSAASRRTAWPTGLVTSLPLADSMVLPRIGDAPFSRRGVLRPRARSGLRRGADHALRHPLPGPDGARRHALGRQSAEGAAGPRTRLRPEGPDRRRSRRAASMSARRASSTSNSWTCARARLRLLVISEDLEELLTLSDRIAVMYEGRIAGVLDAAEASIARLGLLMSGAEAGAHDASPRAREATPAWLNLALPLAGDRWRRSSSAAASIALAGAECSDAYGVMLLGTALGDSYAITETLVKAAPMIFTGLAVAVAFRAQILEHRRRGPAAGRARWPPASSAPIPMPAAARHAADGVARPPPARAGRPCPGDAAGATQGRRRGQLAAAQLHHALRR